MPCVCLYGGIVITAIQIETKLLSFNGARRASCVIQQLWLAWSMFIWPVPWRLWIINASLCPLLWPLRLGVPVENAPPYYSVSTSVFFLALSLSCCIVFLQDSPRAFPSVRGAYDKESPSVLFWLLSRQPSFQVLWMWIHWRHLLLIMKDTLLLFFEDSYLFPHILSPAAGEQAEIATTQEPTHYSWSLGLKFWANGGVYEPWSYQRPVLDFD